MPQSRAKKKKRTTESEHVKPLAAPSGEPLIFPGDKMRTDKERIDFLQKLTDKAQYTGRVILRSSTTRRGWRLHETMWDGSVPDVRDAIDTFMDGKQ